MACAVQGAITRFSFNGYQMPFVKIDDQSVRNLVDDNEDVITGLMDPIKERVSLGLQLLTLNVRLNPTPLELTQILPYLGMTVGAGTWTLDESLASFPVVIDRSTKVHTYTTCYVNAWNLSGQKGNKPLSLDLQIFGMTFSEGTSFGSPTALQTDAPYPFSTGVMTLGGTGYPFDRFAFGVNHHLERYFENALTADCIAMTHRTATLATSMPYNSATAALHTTPFNTNADGLAGVLAFTRGNQSTTITINNIKAISRPPSIPAKVGLRLPLFYRVYRTIAAKAFTVVNDDSV